MRNIKQYILHTYTRIWLSKRKRIRIGTQLSDYEEIGRAEISTNEVEKIQIKGNIYYFRKCRLHKRFKYYFNEALIEYIQQNIKDWQEFYREIKKAFRVRRNYYAFISMGTRSDLKSNLNKSLISGDFEIIGIPEELTLRFQDKIGGFAIFMASVIETYKLNKYVPYYEYENYSSSRIIATRKIAEALGVERIVPDVIYVELKGRKDKAVGTISKTCPGESPYKKNIFVRDIASAFQSDLSDLELLDVICYHKDHGRQNYNVYVEKGNACRMGVFDNDAPSSFFPTISPSFCSYDGISPLVKKVRSINRPYMNVGTVNHMRMITIGRWYKLLIDYLSPIEIVCSYIRLKRLLAAIDCSIAKGELALLDCEDWNKDTIQKELDGDYGKTMLCEFNEYVMDNLRKEYDGQKKIFIK